MWHQIWFIKAINFILYPSAAGKSKVKLEMVCIPAWSCGKTLTHKNSCEPPETRQNVSFFKPLTWDTGDTPITEKQIQFISPYTVIMLSYFTGGLIRNGCLISARGKDCKYENKNCTTSQMISECKYIKL